MAFAWDAAATQLEALQPGPETDEYIDALANEALGTPGTIEAAPALLRAVRLAQHSLTQRSTALALALSAGSQNRAAVDVLITAYREHQQDSFLLPAYLEALSILALESPLARIETTGALLRLNPSDPPFLLIKAAKIIGLLSNIHQDPALREKLQEISTTEDTIVRSEVSYQLGLFALRDALLVTTREELLNQLTESRNFFLQAVETDEQRPDAALFMLLIDAIHLVAAMPQQEQRSQKLVDRVNELYEKITNWNTQAWHSYRSPMAELIEIRMFSIADALLRTILSMNEANDWTNFDHALINLAIIYNLLSLEQHTIYGDDRLNQLTNVLDAKIVAPKLGPLLLRAVGRHRLSVVIERYRSTHGDDDILKRLLILEQAVVDVETQATQQSDRPLSEETKGIIQNFKEAVEEGHLDRWLRDHDFGAPTLPIDHPDLYGGDPQVDEVVRGLLHQLRGTLGIYPDKKWHRLKLVLERVVGFIQYLRDTLPPFMLCKEDGGLGQSASEQNLQDSLFGSLRAEFGRGTIYEQQPIGGGRPDTGARFPECLFPIEVKAEFSSIDPANIKAHYLTQSDIYAAATDRVAFILILDLRSGNAAAHIKNKPKAQKNQIKQVSLYSLKDSFWIDQLLPDPQLPQSQSNVTIIGLVPGNRPRPSSTTTYSKRPASARKP